MRRGSHHSPETLKKMSEALGDEKNPNWGRTPSPETRQKMSKAQMGHPVSAETRQKLSRAHQGKHGGEKNANWKGGRLYHGGYIQVYAPGHPNANKRGYIFEHRLVISNHLGRPLKSSEIVHHKNGVKDDNRLQNLELLPRQVDHLAIWNLEQESSKWERAFYRAAAMWLGTREGRCGTR